MGHHHHHHIPTGKNQKVKLVASIIINLVITLAQIIGAILSGSLSLLSDAMHNFTDTTSLGISLSAITLGSKSPSTTKTFGHKRAEIFAAFINSISLVAVAVYLLIESVDRLNNPTTINSSIVIALGILSIILNGFCVFLLASDSKNSMNIRSSYLHLLSDMVTSIAVVLGGVAIHLWQIYWIDVVIAIAMATYLIWGSLSILVQSTKVLLLYAPECIDLHDVKKELTQIPPINNIHHVHLWQLNENDIHFEAHVSLDQDLAVSQTTTIQSEIGNKLRDKFNIGHCILQFEYRPSCDSALVDEHC